LLHNKVTSKLGGLKITLADEKIHGQQGLADFKIL
jgi:hypothetical protein